MAKNIIVINRGDTYTFDLTVDDANSDDGIYKLVGEDTLYLGVMLPHHPFETAIIKKFYVGSESTKENPDGIQDSNGNLTAVITPEDTIDLYPGVYYYSVKLHQDHDIETLEGTQHVDCVMTVIDKTKFVIND